MIISSHIHAASGPMKYLATEGPRISYVGNEKPCGEEILDLSGYHVYPGFIDSHIHLMQYGLSLFRCDLSLARSRSDILNALKVFADEHDGISHIIAEGYDDSLFAGKDMVCKADLDSMFKGIPVVVRRICGHKGVVNEKALKMLRGSSYFNDSIYDERGGVIEEGAILHLNSVFSPSGEQKEKALKTASAKLYEMGITSAGDMSTLDSLKYYENGIISQDIIPYMPSDSLHMLDDDMCMRRIVRGIKVFLDGSIGARTAAMKRPYRNTDINGDILVGNDYMKKIIKYANQYNLQIAAHAIGDRAIDFALQHLREGDRIEHCEFADEEMLGRISEKGIFLSMQPNFVGNWGMKGQMYENELDHNYFIFNNSYAYIDSMGIKLGMGSDNMPPSPLYGIKSAASALFPNQRISAKRCMELYTKGSSDIMFLNRGALEMGSYADFTVLSRSIQSEPEIMMTVKNSEIVYKRGQL